MPNQIPADNLPEEFQMDVRHLFWGDLTNPDQSNVRYLHS